jgi:hypothetical protein
MSLVEDITLDVSIGFDLVMVGYGIKCPYIQCAQVDIDYMQRSLFVLDRACPILRHR